MSECISVTFAIYKTTWRTALKKTHDDCIRHCLSPVFAVHWRVKNVRGITARRKCTYPTERVDTALQQEKFNRKHRMEVEVAWTY
jgi:hypothetical protein